MKRALERYDVNVVGVTLSKNQHAYCEQLLAGVDTKRTHKVLLQDWAEVSEPVDRIVMIEALEHFGFERYDDFFEFAYDLMPDDGVMMVHSITALTAPQMAERGMPLTFSMARFIKFVMTEIFPGGRLPSIEKVEEHSTKAGFKVDPDPVVAVRFRQDTGHVGRRAGVPQRRGDRDTVRRGLRAVHEVPQGHRRQIPYRLHRHQSVHDGEIVQ